MDDDLLTLVAGFLQELARLGRVLLVVEGLHLVARVERAVGIEQRGVLAGDAAGDFGHLLCIHHGGDGLADLHVAGDAVVAAQDDGVDAAGEDPLDHHVVPAPEKVDLLHLDIGEMGGAGLHGGDAGADLGQEVVAQRVDVHGLAAGEAIRARGGGVGGVVIEAAEGDVAVLHQFAEAEGAGADGGDFARALGGFLGGDDRHREARGFHHVQQDGGAFLQVDDEGVGIRRFHARHLGEDRRVRADPGVALHGGEHVGRGHGLAVVELHALAQREGELLAVGRHIDLAGEHRLGRVVVAHHD